MRDKIVTFKAKAQADSVDLENRVIRNVILAQVGEAKGHGISVEMKFINAIVAQGQNDVLSNFGHNWDNMGLQLGRVKNVHTDGDKAVGDLHIYANADNSPKFPKMGSWVMQQAFEDPESLMLSITFKSAYYYQYSENNVETRLATDRWGYPIAAFKDAVIFIALGKLLSVDVVDSGALTDKMFGEDDRGLFQKFMNFFKKDKKDMAATPNTPNPDEVIDNVPPVALAQITIGDKTFKAKDVTDLLTELSALKTKDADNQVFMSAFKAEIKQLKTENQELKATPAADLTNGATGSPAPAKAMSRSEKFNASINASIGK